MTPPNTLQTILKDSNDHLTLFSDDEIASLRGKIFTKTIRGKETAFVTCVVRDREI